MGAHGEFLQTSGTVYRGPPNRLNPPRTLRGSTLGDRLVLTSPSMTPPVTRVSYGKPLGPRSLTGLPSILIVTISHPLNDFCLIYKKGRNEVRLGRRSYSFMTSFPLL